MVYYITTLLVYAGIDAIACLGLSQQFGIGGVTNFGFIIFQAAGAYTASVLSLPPDSANGAFQTYIGGLNLPFPFPWIGAAIVGGLLAVQFTTTSFFQGADSGGSTATFVASATGCIAKLGADIWVKIGMLIGSGALGPVPMTVTGHDTPVAAGPAPTAPPLTA